jgi:hypothetical protein
MGSQCGSKFHGGLCFSQYSKCFDNKKRVLTLRGGKKNVGKTQKNPQFSVRKREKTDENRIF